jgi:hypothetical protein
MSISADYVGSLQRRQQAKLQSYRPTYSEIPGDYRCAGECSQPPPPMPAEASMPSRTVPVIKTGFTDYSDQQSQDRYWLVMSVASLSFMAISLAFSGSLVRQGK